MYVNIAKLQIHDAFSFFSIASAANTMIRKLNPNDIS